MTQRNVKERPQRLTLDQAAIDAASKSLDDGAVTPGYGPWRDDIVKLLNDALATELVCVLRYKRHYFTATGVASPAIADEFLVHANEESAHADKIAERIVQLGGEPDFNPTDAARAQPCRLRRIARTCRPWCAPTWWPSASRSRPTAR